MGWSGELEESTGSSAGPVAYLESTQLPLGLRLVESPVSCFAVSRCSDGEGFPVFLFPGLPMFSLEAPLPSPSSAHPLVPHLRLQGVSSVYSNTQKPRRFVPRARVHPCSLSNTASTVPTSLHVLSPDLSTSWGWLTGAWSERPGECDELLQLLLHLSSQLPQCFSRL